MAEMTIDQRFKAIKADLMQIQASGDSVLYLADAMLTLDKLYAQIINVDHEYEVAK